MKTGFIYLIFNCYNDKVYIGSTTKDVSIRLRTHCDGSKYLRSDTKKLRNSKLYSDMRRLSSGGFHIIELEIVQYNEIIELRKIEDKYILQYNSIDNGYNMKRAITCEIRKKELGKISDARYRKTDKYKQWLKNHQQKPKTKLREREYRENNPEACKDRIKASRKKNVDSKKYYCEVCDYPARDKSSLTSHLKGILHHKRASGLIKPESILRRKYKRKYR